MTTTGTADREIVTTRLINAPRELVWMAFTDPAHVQHWWGPNGFTNTIHEMEVKPGGVWRFMMHGPDGRDWPNKIVFREVVKPERLSYVHSSDDENDPNFFENTVTFEARGKQTFLTMRALLASAEEKERLIREVGADEGGKQTINKLEQYLADLDKEPFTIERTYNAPVEKVWKALTDKAEMKKWYFDLAEFRPEPGFEFSFIGGSPDGEKFNHLCKVMDVVPNKKLKHSWRYENYEGVSYVTWELFPEGDKTVVKLTHEGLGSFPAKTNPAFAKQNFVQGWTGITGVSLKEYLEKK